MILDKMTELSLAQAVTSTGDTASTNVYDTGSAFDIGVGEDLYLYVKSKAALTSGGAATVALVLQDSADNSSWADVQIVLPATAYTTFTANRTALRTRLPIGLRRYVRLVYRVATAALTGGTFDANIAIDVQAQQYGTSGFSVS